MAFDIYKVARGLGINGAANILSGTNAPGGDSDVQDASPFGTIYLRIDGEINSLYVYVKVSTINNTVADWDQLTTLAYVQSELDSKEDSFLKNTAFNKNFGTAADTVAEGNHTHDGTSVSLTKDDVGLGNVDNVQQIPLSSKGAAEGVAELDTGGKVPLSQINDALLGQVSYQGTWNADTNTPTLPDPTTVKGDYYVVSIAGTQFTLEFEIGDWAISDGVKWDIVNNTDAVRTVFGRLGDISANTNDYTWAQINKAVSSIADITTKSHTLLTDIGSNTHAQIDNHINDTTKHREINDSSVVDTVLWSASKINAELNLKENSFLKNTAFNKNFGTSAGTVAEGSHVGSGGTSHAIVTGSVAGFMSATDKTKLDGIASGATSNSGTVTSVGVSGSTGLAVSGSPITTSGTIGLTLSANLQAWSGVATTSKQDALGFTPANSTISISTGTGLSGGGNLTTNQTISLALASAPSFTWTNRQVTTAAQDASSSMSTSTGNLGGWEFRSQGSIATAGAAFVAFHRPGAYAAYFGLDTDNKWKVGGWSMGANSYEIWHAGTFNPASKVDTTRSITAGNGLTGGGDLSSNKNDHSWHSHHDHKLHNQLCRCIRAHPRARCDRTG